jgi:uncharacterized protein (TIGR00730 family)
MTEPLEPRPATPPTSSRSSPQTPPRLDRAPLAYENTAFLQGHDGRLLRMVAEFSEPLARFRHQKVQDTVVFFGSARFRSLDEASHELELLENTGSAKPAPIEEQPAHDDAEAASDLRRKRAEAAVEMARYCEDARELAYRLTKWALTLKKKRERFVVTTGGGPGIMEAANRGAYEAGGKTIGLNIKLPFEQLPNPYVTPELNFEFHYFFMRKYWFAYLAKALVVFPGGFGTLDEMFEVLTLAQTDKLAKQIKVILYGSSYWNSVLDMDVLVEKGAISPRDRNLFQMADTPDEAFALLQSGLSEHHVDSEGKHPASEEDDDEFGPEIAHTR